MSITTSHCFLMKFNVYDLKVVCVCVCVLQSLKQVIENSDRPKFTYYSFSFLYNKAYLVEFKKTTTKNIKIRKRKEASVKLKT